MAGSDPKHLIRIARESGDDAPVAPLNLGERVRDLRKARGWTLEQAAGQAGLARSTLSKIENGQMSPTYEALKKLAEGLSISVPQPFTPPSKAQVSGRMTTTKAGEGQGHATATYEHELLAAQMTRKQMSRNSTVGSATMARNSFMSSPAWSGFTPNSTNPSTCAAATAPIMTPAWATTSSACRTRMRRSSGSPRWSDDKACTSVAQSTPWPAALLRCRRPSS